MAKVGIAVIGQAPRADIVNILAGVLPRGTDIALRGCLDGLSDREVNSLAPQSGGDTLYTRLRGKRDVKISKAAVVERAPETLAHLRAEGAEALLFACTGEFPPMHGDGGVVFPSRILAGLVAALLPQGRLGLLVPAPEQIEKLSQKWRRSGVDVIAEALLPSAGESDAEAAAARLAQCRPNLVAMDCMSYTPSTKAIVKRVARVPTVLAITAIAAVLQELLS
jgi:protein AroM